MRDRLRLAAVSEMERRRGEFIGVQLHSKVSIFSHPSGGYGTHMYAIAAVPPLTYLCRRFKEGGEEGRKPCLGKQRSRGSRPSIVRVILPPIKLLFIPSLVNISSLRKGGRARAECIPY